MDFGVDEEVGQVGAGRDFALMVTTNGKLYYTGKSAAIGHKQPCQQGTAFFFTSFFIALRNGGYYSQLVLLQINFWL